MKEVGFQILGKSSYMLSPINLFLGKATTNTHHHDGHSNAQRLPLPFSASQGLLEGPILTIL